MNGGWEKMCNNSNDNTSPVPTSSAIVPYSLKSLQAAVAAATAVSVNDPTTTAAAAYMAASIHHHNPAAHLTQAALDHYRMQLYSYVSYADRLRYAHHHHHPGNPPGLALATSAHHHHHHPYAGPHALVPMTTGAGHAVTDVYALAASPYPKFDPCRAYRLHQEEPKPQHSYIGLIGMAILSSADKKLVLSDIYQYILDNYSYFRNRGPGWRNSIRHNLSLNDCFVKAGRSANGKGHFWAIHPANLEDFKKGDFRRRKAQRRVRKHLGLSVPEDDDSVSPPPPTPTATVSPPSHTTTLQQHELQQQQQHQNLQQSWSEKPDSTTTLTSSLPIVSKKRRQFDMDSILAPERRSCCNCSEEMTGSVVCCNDVQCSNRAGNGGAALFGTIFKTAAGAASVIHGKAIASTTWVESGAGHQVEQPASHCKSRDDEDSAQERKTSDQLMMMMDECSSSSVVIEATPNWSMVSEEDEVDSRPNSRSSNSSESCSNGSGYSVTLRREADKGLSSSKGPKAAARDSPTQIKQRHANFLSTRSTAATVARNAEPLLTAAAGAGPLALIATGRPISHSNSVSATVVSENQT